MKKIKRVFAVLLSLAMIVALVPASALAAGGDDEGGEPSTTSSGVELSKTATLEEDGTYTIQLEAYATGEVTTTTTTKTVGVPCDIVLVLDQSGSMTSAMGNTTRLQALKDAANTFIKQVQQDAAENNVDHKIAVVGFASGSSSSYTNTELLSTENVVNYSSATTTDYQAALVSANVSGNVNSRLTNAITSVAADGSTYANVGFQMAQNILDSRNEKTYKAPDGSTANRKTIVVFFTDGYPGYQIYSHYPTTYPTYDWDTNDIDRFADTYYYRGDTKQPYILDNISTANNTISLANTLKNSGTTIYSVGVFEGSAPADSYNFTIKTNSGNSTTCPKYYTSGVQAANAYLHFVSSDYAAVTGTPTMETYDRTTVVDNGYYLAASSADELNKVFETISSSINTSTSSTTSTLDANSILRDVMATGFDASNAEVTVQTAAYKGNNAWDAAGNFNATVTNQNGVIDVKGFSYKDNYVAEAGGDLFAQGKKLIVTIKGVLPTDDAVTGEAVNTNASASGIYADASAETAAAVFPRPQTILTSKSYVLDYAKTADLDTLGLDSVKSIVSAFQAVTGSENSVAGTYGNTNLSGDSASYTPKTTKWDGYDSFYAFGKAAVNVIPEEAVVTNNGNLWSKINVIPANNVYYEDDFITSETAGTVGIEYTGTWDIVGESVDNTETANGAVQGWEESLADDTGYSDGSAHVSSTSGATATFTFTGTGVDIYSRTNDKTGTIYVTVKSTKDGTTTTKRTVVDNKAKSGDYYQIPTYTFSGEYGTYEVTVRVTTGAASKGRYTYYLDGIRVYNPINPNKEDATVQEAYGPDEINAVFTEVRGLLDESSGVAFVDEGENGDPVSKNYLDTEVSELAPEHEVYLAKNQSIVIAVDGTASAYYIGLKAPNGATSVAFSADADTATTTIDHSTDLYYEVTPNNGTITIKNTGTNLLSITKLRTAGSGKNGIATLSVEEAEEAVVTFNAAKRVAYQSVGATDEELTEQEQPEVTEPEETEPETPVEEEPGEVIIENPEVPEEAPVEAPSASSNSWVKNLFSGIKNLFGRR